MSSGHDCKDCNERYNACKCVQPPIGLMPENLWKFLREQDIKNAIVRYAKADLPIPFGWIQELSKLRELQG